MVNGTPRISIGLLRQEVLPPWLLRSAALNGQNFSVANLES